MKECLACGGISAEKDVVCRRCGRKLLYFNPAPRGASLDPERDTTEEAYAGMTHSAPLSPANEGSVLYGLGVFFYLAAGANVLCAIAIIDSGFQAAAVFLIGAISALFFGAMCVAAHDVRATLRSIDAKLTRASESGSSG